MMRAVVFDSPGDESVLRTGTVASPAHGPGEVRIRVAAVGLNRADLLQRRGLYPPPPGASPILGLECAGTVAAVGDEVTTFQKSDRVMALLSGGGYAEEAVAPEECVMHTPDSLSDEAAAAVPEVFLTSFLNLFMIGNLRRRAIALVHGGSGGLGTSSIQLIRRSGARVFVTAGSDERCGRCEELGAERAINYRTQSFATEVLEATNGRGVDIVLDCVGGSYFEHHLKVLAVGGRLVVIGLQGGSRSTVDLAALMQKRLSVVGSTLRSRPTAEKGCIVEAFKEQFGADLENGLITPVIDRVMAIEHVGEAHRAMAAGEVFGKIVLRF